MCNEENCGCSCHCGGFDSCGVCKQPCDKCDYESDEINTTSFSSIRPGSMFVMVDTPSDLPIGAPLIWIKFECYLYNANLTAVFNCVGLNTGHVYHINNKAKVMEIIG